jgi:hypothetical protein
VVISDDHLIRTGEVPKYWEFHIFPKANLADAARLIDTIKTTNTKLMIATVVGWLNKDRATDGIRKEIYALANSAKKRNLELFFMGVSTPFNQPKSPGAATLNTIAEKKFENNFIRAWSDIMDQASTKLMKPNISEYVGLFECHYGSLADEEDFD